MTVNYTTNLALGQPVTGTESGTWGDDVNNSVTSYLDIAIAGGLSVSITTTDVTLTLTQGTSSATNIGSTTAQYAILNVSGAMTAARNLILPSSSRQYVINNACTGGFLLTVKGSATSGVTMVNGESAHIYWNGSDYAKAANTAGVATFTNLTYTGTLTGSTGVIAIGTNQIYKDSSGNVGIGTSSPRAKLDVSGIALIGTYQTSTNYAPLSVKTVSSVTTPSTFTNAVNIWNGTTVGEYSNITFGYNTLGLTNAAAYMGFVSTSATGNGKGDLVFGTRDVTTDTAATERMRIDSSGNVGIGTSSPSSKLSVVSTGETFTISGGGTGTQYQRFNTTGGNYYIGVSSSTGSGLLGGASAYSMCLVTESARDMLFGTNNTERMRITSAGDVGIGTNSPNVRTEVSGTEAAVSLRVNTANTGISTSNYSQIQLSDTGAVRTYWRNVRDGTGQTQFAYNSVLAFLSDAAGTPTERMRLDSSGNLLVGTTSTLVSANEKVSVDCGSTNGLTTKTSGGASSWNYFAWNSATSGNNGFIEFGTEASYTARGSITYNRGAGLVAYNVTSDYRAKDISGPVTNSGALIDSVPVYMGTMKGATQERPMFIAHETPDYAHTGEKDAVDADGNPVYQQMDASALVPVMWAEIQSLRKRLTDAGIA